MIFCDKSTSVFIAFFLIVKLGFDQQNTKKDLYLLFKQNQVNAFKHSKVDTAFYNHTTRLRLPASNHDEYWYRFGLKETYTFVTVNNTRYYICDSNFVKYAAKPIDQLRKIKAFGYGTWDKEYPFKRVFIVEYLAENKYKVVEVTSWIGVEN